MICGRRHVQVMVLVTVVVMMTAFSIAWAASDLDTLKTKLQALERTAAGTSDEEKLLKDIGALAQQLKTMPLPKEARRHMARGEAYVEIAKDKEGFKRAAKEFEAAAKAAPWLASAYYNLGIVQDKAGLYSQAMRSLKIYLAIAPDAPDAAAVEKLIFKIEVRQEAVTEQRRKVEKGAETAKKPALLQKGFSRYAGTYYNIVLCDQTRHAYDYYKVEIFGDAIEISCRYTHTVKEFSYEQREIYKGTVSEKGRIQGTATEGIYILSNPNGKCVNRYMHYQFQFEGELKTGDILTSQGKTVSGDVIVLRAHKSFHQSFDYGRCIAVPNDWRDSVKTLVREQ
jgi:tetratricopeptide (TPR) repeat protein